MSKVYHVYGNGGSGPVDYGTILATTSGLSHDVGPLAAPSETTFAVRTYDTVAAAEDQNTDARATIAVSATNGDISGLPGPPVGLGAAASGAGAIRVSWSYNPLGRAVVPTGFHVYLGTPTVSYGSPAATVAFNASVSAYSSTLSGLADGAPYQAGVRAYVAAGEERNAAIATAVASTTGPSPVSGLTATLL